MKARPQLRNILIKPADRRISEESEEGFSGFEIPSEFYETRHDAERFDLFEVEAVGPEVPAATIQPGDLVLVEIAMVEIVETPHGTVTFVPYNYVPIVFK